LLFALDVSEPGCAHDGCRQVVVGSTRTPYHHAMSNDDTKMMSDDDFKRLLVQRHESLLEKGRRDLDEEREKRCVAGKQGMEFGQRLRELEAAARDQLLKYADVGPFAKRDDNDALSIWEWNLTVRSHARTLPDSQRVGYVVLFFWLGRGRAPAGKDPSIRLCQVAPDGAADLEDIKGNIREILLGLVEQRSPEEVKTFLEEKRFKPSVVSAVTIHR